MNKSTLVSFLVATMASLVLMEYFTRSFANLEKPEARQVKHSAKMPAGCGTSQRHSTRIHQVTGSANRLAQESGSR